MGALLVALFFGRNVYQRKRIKSLSEETMETMHCIREGQCIEQYENCGEDQQCASLVRRPSGIVFSDAQTSPTSQMEWKTRTLMLSEAASIITALWTWWNDLVTT